MKGQSNKEQQKGRRRASSMDVSNISETGSKHSNQTFDPVEIKDKTDKIFMLTLLSFHMNNKLEIEQIRQNQG